MEPAPFESRCALRYAMLPSKASRRPGLLIRAKISPSRGQNATNEPESRKNVTNEPRKAQKNVTNEATESRKNVTNEPSLAKT